MEIKILHLFLLLICIGSSFSYLVGVDFNTYSINELNDAIKYFGHVDFTWAITVNSSGVTSQLWKQVFSSINNQMVFSEDNPMEFKECSLVRQYSGTLSAAFGYHEAKVTQLTWDQITQYSDHCQGSGVIILTRAYWPNSDWKNNTDKVLHHPKLYGVAMQFNPSDFGKRSQVDFVNSIIGAGKTAFFLLPFIQVAKYPTEKQITDFINYLKVNHVNLSQNRIRFVLARYDKPYIPISGSTNSIDSAIKSAMRLKNMVQVEVQK